ncbi:hypothetical protein Tco_1424935 [Tanacetum coccineum]
MSPTVVLFDVDIGRIYIRHYEVLKSTTLNVLERSGDNDAYWHALSADTYFALVVEIASAVCFLENHDVKQHPMKVLRRLGSIFTLVYAAVEKLKKALGWSFSSAWLTIPN